MNSTNAPLVALNSNIQFGAMFSKKSIYRPNADLLFTAFNVKSCLNEKSIVHFYVWDTEFKPIEEKAGFLAYLNEIKELGVKYVCQTDFSCWFHYDEQRRANIIKNFEYHDIINKMGFEQILNFNTIFIDHFTFYKKHLKKEYFGVVFDLNHSEDKYIDVEVQAFKMLLTQCKFGYLFFLTGKRNWSVKKRYWKLLQLAYNYRLKVIIVPTVMVVLRVKKELFYDD